LTGGEGLRLGDHLLSANHGYRLDLINDGNLKLFNVSTGALLWETNT